MNELAMLGQLKSRGLFCKVSLVPFPHSVRRVVVSDVHVFFLHSCHRKIFPSSWDDIIGFLYRRIIETIFAFSVLLCG